MADESRAEVQTGNERILFVDDEELIRDMGTELLASLGYRVTSTSDSGEALRVFREMPDGFDLLITDQTMPNMTGLELVEQILQIRPGFPIILCTGFSTKVSEAKVASAGIRHLYHKPIRRRDLATKIREILDS